MAVEYGTTGGGIPTLWARVPYEQRDLTRQIPGRQWDPQQKVWRWLAARPADLQRLTEQLLSTFPGARQSDRQVAPVGELPPPDGPTLESMVYPSQHTSRRTPYAHQREAVSAATARDKFLLLLEMGLGKTQIAIEAASLALMDGTVNRVVITCPLSVVSNWEREILACALISPDDIAIVGANPSVRSGKRARGMTDAQYRAAQIARRATWTIIHYDLVRLHDDELASLVADQFLVCDESHKLKSAASQVSKTVRGWAPRQTIAMTGTPVANAPEDLWAQGSLVDPDLFGSHRAFEATYLQTYSVRGKKNFTKVVGYKNLDDLGRRLSLVSLRRTKEQCLDLPAKVFQSRQCVMSDEQARAYQRAQDEMLLELQDKDGQWLETHALSINAMVTRLSQIADGYGSVDAGAAHWYPNTGKLAVMDELLDELSDRKVVVFSRYLPPVLQLADRYRSAVTIHGGVSSEQRATAQERFANDQDCRLFIGQVDAAGLGLNLQAGSAIVFYDLPWSPAAFNQATDRCHRIGQTRSVDVIDLQAVTPDGEETIDASVARLLGRKQRVADSITDAARLRALITGREEGRA